MNHLHTYLYVAYLRALRDVLDLPIVVLQSAQQVLLDYLPLAHTTRQLVGVEVAIMQSLEELINLCLGKVPREVCEALKGRGLLDFLFRQTFAHVSEGEAIILDEAYHVWPRTEQCQSSCMRTLVGH